MAMRMPPQVAQQTALPAVNRSSLVFFAGLALILLQFYWQNGSAVVNAIFHKGSDVQLEGYTDTGLQLLGLALLTLAAEYGGENAGTAALLFVAALWILWLLTHFGTTPKEAAPTHTEANPPSN